MRPGRVSRIGGTIQPGTSRTVATPMPRGSRPSIAACTSVGAIKASVIVRLTCLILQFLARSDLLNIRDRSRDQLIEPMPPLRDRGDELGAGLGADWTGVGMRGCRRGENNLPRSFRRSLFPGDDQHMWIAMNALVLFCRVPTILRRAVSFWTWRKAGWQGDSASRQHGRHGRRSTPCR